jgi:ribosome biogenesis protein BMS1
MFNSAMEVAKFEHAKLKTVSGIRGSVKKALRESNHIASDGAKGSAAAKQPPGTFRATFEDKILMSDLVICRLWVPVVPKDFYNPVLSLLAEYAQDKPSAGGKSARVEELGEDDAENSDHEGGDVPKTLKSATGNIATVPKVPLMRTTAEIRREQQIPLVVNKDSVYKPIAREQRQFGKFKVPVKLQEALPFATKPKQQAAKNREGYLAKRAVILEPEEKKARAVVQMLSTVRKDKQEKRHAAGQERLQKKRKAKEMEAERFEDQAREEKRAKYRDEGKKKAHRPSKK